MAARKNKYLKSFQEFQDHAKTLGGFSKLAFKLVSVEYIYRSFIELFQQSLIEFRQQSGLTLEEAAAFLQIDAAKLASLEAGDKNFSFEDYLDSVYRYAGRQQQETTGQIW